MKILHVCLANFYIDDTSYQENMLAKFHVLQGHDVTVLASLVTFDKFGKYSLLEGESVYVTEDNYKVIRVDYSRKGIYNLNKRFRIYNNIYDKIVDEKPDIIFVHGCQFIDIKYIKKYVQKADNSVKVFVDNHADFINSAKNWLSKKVLHKIFWKHCAKTIEPFVVKFYGVTPNRCKFLEDVYNIPKEKIELLVMGFDDTILTSLNNERNIKRLKDELQLSSNDFIITTGGKIRHSKNIHLLMEAVKNLDTKNIKLLVFGSVVPEIKELFDSLNNHSSIKYLGWKSHEEIVEIFSISNLIVFPGSHSVLWEEAVGCGIPSVFKYYEGMTHVDVGGNCIFLKEDSVAEVQQAIYDIYGNESLYSKMKKSAIENKELFSYNYISKKAISCDL